MSRVKKEFINLRSDVGSLEYISFSYIKTDAEKNLALPVICSKSILINVLRDVSFIDMELLDHFAKIIPQCVKRTALSAINKNQLNIIGK